MEKEKTVPVEINDLYRLLIGEMRYAYDRNNHLMPSSAYGEVKKYLDRMIEVEPSTALHTASQLCDECISDQLTKNFWSALDDEVGNRKEAVDFVNYLMIWIHKKAEEHKNYQGVSQYIYFRPYNYNQFEANVEREKALRYDLTITFNDKTIKEESLTEDDCYDKVLEFLRCDSFVSIGNMSLFSDKEPNKVSGKEFVIESPTSYKGTKVKIELTME
jgi:hypothetical protein